MLTPDNLPSKISNVELIIRIFSFYFLFVLLFYNMKRKYTFYTVLNNKTTHINKHIINPQKNVDIVL
jgi:hypothetical protein